jgi:hypothetical protein
MSFFGIVFGVTLSITFVWVLGLGDHSLRRSFICILGTYHKFSILMHWNLNSFSGCTSLVWTFTINVFCHPDTYVRSINKCSIMSWFGTTFQTNWIASSTILQIYFNTQEWRLVDIGVPNSVTNLVRCLAIFFELKNLLTLYYMVLLRNPIYCVIPSQ